MVTIRLDYPYREDIESYDVPLPETFDMKGVCVLLFRDAAWYYCYLNELCELVDNLEFDLMTRRTTNKLDKLKFCKQYLAFLADAWTGLFTVDDGHQSVS